MDIKTQVQYYGGEIEVLHDDEWLSLHVLRVPSMGINGFTFAHQSKGDGNSVAILPFRTCAPGDPHIEILFLYEVVPPWGLDPSGCAITGLWDHQSETFIETAARELHEEAGFRSSTEKLIRLGTCRGVKCSDTTYHLYAVDVTGLEQEEAPGDGSRLEAAAHTHWETNLPKDCSCPLIQTMILRLLNQTDYSF